MEHNFDQRRTIRRSLPLTIEKTSLVARLHNKRLRRAAEAHARNGARKGGRRNIRNIKPITTLNTSTDESSRMRAARLIITLCVAPLQCKPRERWSKILRMCVEFAATRAQATKGSLACLWNTESWCRSAKFSMRISTFPPLERSWSLVAICVCKSATSAHRDSREDTAD